MGTEDGIKRNSTDFRLPKKEYIEIPCYKCGQSFLYFGDACWQVTCPNCRKGLDVPKLRKMGVEM